MTYCLDPEAKVEMMASHRTSVPIAILSVNKIIICFYVLKVLSTSVNIISSLCSDTRLL